jgi:hypothetical protein
VKAFDVPGLFSLRRHARACRGHPRLGIIKKKDVVAGTWASEATPFFERLCPAMTGGYTRKILT